MANKNRKTQAHQAQQQKLKQKQYDAATKNLFIFPCIALGLTVLALLFLFVNFAEVYNTQLDNPVEVAVRGWSFFIVGLTGNYTAPNKIYGDLAVPFYLYAAEWCETLALVAVFAVLITVLYAVVQIITIIKKTHGLNIASAVLGLISAVLFIVCYAEGLAMKDGNILSLYCSNNPNCSIKSYAIVSAIIMLGATAVSAFAAYKTLQASKLLKQ